MYFYVLFHSHCIVCSGAEYSTTPTDCGHAGHDWQWRICKLNWRCCFFFVRLFILICIFPLFGVFFMACSSYDCRCLSILNCLGNRRLPVRMCGTTRQTRGRTTRVPDQRTKRYSQSAHGRPIPSLIAGSPMRSRSSLWKNSARSINSMRSANKLLIE